jgi:hypothetical protein
MEAAAQPMNALVAVVVAAILNVAILVLLRKRYHPEVYDVLAKTYLASICIRYLLAGFLWLNYENPQFNSMFWGDSYKYDMIGASIANEWSHGYASSTWRETIEGKTNAGFVYVVASVYYVFGHNVLLMQFLNGVIGTLVSVVVFEIALLLYDRGVATRAMLLTTFFPQMMFWSCAIYKDPLVMLCAGLNILAVLRLRERFQLHFFVIYLLSALAALSLRFYLFYIILAATVCTFFLGRARDLRTTFVVQLLFMASFVGLILFTPVGEAVRTQQIFFDLEQLQVSRSDLASAASGFTYEADVSTPLGALQVLPLGIVYILLAPFPWTLTNLRQLLVLPDVLVWYALMPALFRGLSRAFRNRFAITMPILMFTTSLTIAYAMFLGNAGTAYRQRTQVMMFYFLFIADGMRQRRRQEASAAPSSPSPLPAPSA